MKQGPLHERRQHHRYSVKAELTVRILSSLFSSVVDEQPLEGTLHDISDGGLSILIPQAVPVSNPIRCEIRLPDLPVSIPTLAQVRWVENSPSSAGTRIGLQFLL